MSVNSKNIGELSVNTIRFLSVDAIQKANSGHPGMPMANAPLAYLLYTKLLNHNPKNPAWFNRDRFVLSAGHGSMLLYSVLHLTGYDLPLEEIKNFRQWGSLTPGHPEFGHTAGVETTTGPLGQGFANAVGMALARKHLAAKFNKPGYEIISSRIVGIAGDGDIMEGVCHESASFAGHNKLNNLIMFYDNNNITIDGQVDLSMSEDVQKRFEAYNWRVLRLDDVNDFDKIEKVFAQANEEKEKPVLVITDTVIGYGSPNKSGKSSSHGAPLGEDEVKLTKEALGWNYADTFHIPDEVKAHMLEAIPRGEKLEEEWNKLFAEYKSKFTEEAESFSKLIAGDYGDEWKSALPKFDDPAEKLATRQASGKVLNAIKDHLPTLLGGSADLAGSNNTTLKEKEDFSAGNPLGRNINYGIREHAMGSIMNGMALFGGVIPYGGTFLIFSDYMRPAIRMAALCKLPVKYVFTHDSIGLGEDGPTHQPIEQLSTLRSIPGLTVIRPADPAETSEAWKIAIEHKDGPVAIALTRQKVKNYDRKVYASADGLRKGAYILKKESGDTPEVILISTGSEVEQAVEAAERMEAAGKKVRVVSFPCWQLFESQTEEYKEEVLPEAVKNRVVIEAGIRQGWERYAGTDGKIISIETFGSSAPYSVLFEKYGYTTENIIKVASSF
ncbi:MAG: transketolase [Melioribacteraceae bacterium]|nr:MAG: transketolase [Melioribacteraceae bacterium]